MLVKTKKKPDFARYKNLYNHIEAKLHSGG